MLADKSEPIQIRGSVQWMKERKRYFIGGIKVASAQDEDKLAELVRRTLGIKEEEEASSMLRLWIFHIIFIHTMTF